MTTVSLTRRRRFDDNYWAASHLPASMLNAEAELIELRWPDYNFCSALQATELFYDQYICGLRLTLKRHYDVRQSERVKKIDLRSTTAGSKDLSHIWSARQRADALGAEYRSYIDFSFDFAARRRRSRGAPQINQIGPSSSNEEQRKAWLIEWDKHSDELKRARIQIPAPLPQYHVEHFQDLPAQRGFRRTWLNQMRLVPPNAFQIFRVCIEQRVLPLRSLVPLLGRPSLLIRLKNVRDLAAFASTARAIKPPIEPGGLWQTCFGLPHARDLSLAACQICSQSLSCERFGQLVEEQVMHTLGTEDPAGDRKRALAAARTRKSRALAKARAAAAAATPAGRATGEPGPAEA